MSAEANVPLQGRQGSRGCIPDAPGETGIHLEWKQRSPLCSRVATGISGLPHFFMEGTNLVSRTAPSSPWRSLPASLELPFLIVLPGTVNSPRTLAGRAGPDLGPYQSPVWHQSGDRSRPNLHPGLPWWPASPADTAETACGVKPLRGVPAAGRCVGRSSRGCS